MQKGNGPNQPNESKSILTQVNAKKTRSKGTQPPQPHLKSTPTPSHRLRGAGHGHSAALRGGPRRSRGRPRPLHSVRRRPGSPLTRNGSRMQQMTQGDPLKTKGKGKMSTYCGTVHLLHFHLDPQVALKHWPLLQENGAFSLFLLAPSASVQRQRGGSWWSFALSRSLGTSDSSLHPNPQIGPGSLYLP